MDPQQQQQPVEAGTAKVSSPPQRPQGTTGPADGPPRRVSVSTKRRRLTASTDNRALEVALKSSSLALWVFYAAAALYVAYCDSFFLEGGDQAVTAHSVVGSGTAAAAAFLERAKLSHRYSNYYYYFFSDGFDIAAYIPLVLRVLGFSALAIGTTYLLAVHYENGGELLMVLAWLLGVLSEHFWLITPVSPYVAPASSSSSSSSSSSGSVISSASIGADVGVASAVSSFAAAAAGAVSGSSVVSSATAQGSTVVLYDQRVPTVPGWTWLAVSIATGFFSGVMCKVKDIMEGKLERGRHLLSIFEDDDVDQDEVVVDDVVVVHRAGELGADGLGSRATSNTEPTSATAADTPKAYRSRRRGRRLRGGGASHLIGLGERLYMVVPFCTGQWFAFILRHGWRGIIVENGILILTLGMIGYTMLSFKLLREQVYRTSGRTTVVRYRRTIPCATDADGGSGGAGGSGSGSGGSGSPYHHSGGSTTGATVVEEDDISTTVDLIDLISKIFTTSFGAVALVVVMVNVFITTLAVPFLKALFHLNALASSIGIVVELIVYEMT